MQRIFSSQTEIVSLERTLFGARDKLWIYLPYDRGMAAVETAVFKEVDEGESIEPFLELRYDLMDKLLRSFMEIAWDQGLRPAGFEDYANELKATRTHLEDMRALAFKGKQP